MLEGLWVTRFLTPDVSEMNLSGGVVVIESGRLLGGDSGYFYVGDLGSKSAEGWPITLTITRHDPNVISVFGDMDHFALVGHLQGLRDGTAERHVIGATLYHEAGLSLTVRLTKVSELPG